MKLQRVWLPIGIALFCVVLFQLRTADPTSVRADGVSGEAVYQKHCASCHDQAIPRVPPRAALKNLAAARILRVMDFGVMMGVAYPLKREEREAVANFLGTPGDEPGPAASAYCTDKRPSEGGKKFGDWNGWSPSSANTRFQNASGAGISAEQVGHLKLKWAFGFEGDITAFGGVTIQDGTLFVGSASGAVYGMNAKTGCVYWVFRANGPVRAAPRVAEGQNGRVLLFGDQIGWFYSLDAQTGKQLWRTRVDEHEATRLTASPVSHEGMVFVPAASWEETRSGSPDYPCCTFRGSVTALRIADGSVVWKSFLVETPRKTGVSEKGRVSYGPSGAGVWSAPTLDLKRKALYVTTSDNYSIPATATSDAVVALDLDSGRILWTQQTTANDVYSGACWTESVSCNKKIGPDFDYGASAMLVSDGTRDFLIAGQKSGMVYGLDPDAKGKIVWSTRVGKGGEVGGVQWGMGSDERNVYAAVSDASQKLKGVQDGVVGNAEFDPNEGGGLTAVRISDGKKVWFAKSYPCAPPRPGCSPAQSAAVTVIPGVVFSGSLDGHIRAFSTADGKRVWDFDTVQEYATVNGVRGKGGSQDGAGPVVSDGMVYVNSGYPRFGGMPGNVLLAFEVETPAK